MRTTLIVPDPLVEEARRISGISRITDLVKAGLQALIAVEARKRLVAFGGSDPKATAPTRHRWPDAVAEPPKHDRPR